jgi:hypothetical protein
MTDQQLARSDMLVDQIWDMVQSADHINSDYVFRNLFVRIGKDCIDKGEQLNELHKLCLDHD